MVASSSFAMRVPATSTPQCRLLEEIYSDKGYFIADILDDKHLQDLRDIVNDKFRSVIKLKYPELYDQFFDLPACDYHLKSPLIDHANTWRKAMRTFDHTLVDRFLALPWKRRLADIVGPFELLGLDEVGQPDIYMRVVRPNEPADVGQIHADQWFTELGNHDIDADLTLAKVWVPVYSEPAKDGLIGVPGSHLLRDEIQYESELRDGYVKPVLSEKLLQSIKPIRLLAQPGQAVSFTYDFLHGGTINQGTNSRVSLEFTMILTRDKPLKRAKPAKAEVAPRPTSKALGSDWQGSTREFFAAARRLGAQTVVQHLQSADLELPAANPELAAHYNPNKLALLKTLVPERKNLRVLMFGSDFGITPFAIAEQLDKDSKFTIVESARQIVDVTTRNVGKHKLDTNVSVVQGEFKAVIPYLGHDGPYDLIICDERSHDYVGELVSSLSPGGRMLVDGILESSDALLDHPTNEQGRRAKQLLDRIEAQPNLLMTLLPISSGVLVITLA